MEKNDKADKSLENDLKLAACCCLNAAQVFPIVLTLQRKDGWIFSKMV